MNHDLIPEMKQSCLVSNSVLDVHLHWFRVKIIESEHGTEIGDDLRNANDYIGALLAGEVVELKIDLQSFWLFWVVRLLQTRLHREC